MVSAEDILPQAEKERTEWKEYVRDAADLFHKEEGEMQKRGRALAMLMDELHISVRTSNQTLAALVGDLVDPVVQVPVDGDRYVGVLEYNEYDGAYGYKHYDDVSGQANRVVCAQCVKEESEDRNVVHATSGEGSFDQDADYGELLSAIHDHYDEHDVMPEDVETGASLLSGTTIAGNTAWHPGNDDPLAKQNVGVQAPIFTATTDVPTSITEGEMVYIDNQGDIYVEDGT